MERIHSSLANAKNALRRPLKLKRQAMHPFKRLRAAASARRTLRNFPVLQRAQRIGSYLDVNGEFPMSGINDLLLHQQKAVFFPTISDFQNGQMHFVPWTKNSRLKANKFKIPEVFPITTKQHSQALDLILVPLLGFDNAGNRLGMGGGFYDRYLASYRVSKKPFILGIAYDMQRLAKLETDPWDHPLDAILTETGIQRFRR